MIRIDEENSKLRSKRFPLGKGIRKHLLATLKGYNGDKTKVGYKRLNNILSSEDGISYLDMKRIKNFFDTYVGTPRTDEYLLNGGDEMKWWVEDTLNLARKSVKDEKQVKKDAGISNSFIRPHEKNRQQRKNKPTGVKFKTSNRNSIENKTLKYENRMKNNTNRLKRLVESAVRSALNEYVDPWDVNRALAECGWAYFDTTDVTHRETGQTGVRYKLEKERGGCDEDQLRSRMESIFGKENVIFSTGYHRYAPEITNLSMIILDSDE